MTDNRTTADLEAFLAGANVDGTVATLRPDYRALLIAVSGLAPHAGPNTGESLLAHAEQVAHHTPDQDAGLPVVSAVDRDDISEDLP